jgi:hypothetical protein
VCALPAAAWAAPGASSGAARPAPLAAAGSTAEAPIPASVSNTTRASRTRSSRRSQSGLEGERFLAIANALPKMRALRAEYPEATPFLGYLPNGNPEVVYYQPNGSQAPKKVGVVEIDRRSGRVLAQFTGIQLTWVLARGEGNRWGRHVNALYVWLPMCVLFILPFLNFRRPISLLHLDLLVLLSFSVSFAFFNGAHIYASVPLVYPPLIYLLARMLALLRRDGARAQTGPLRLLVPARWLALGVVLLVVFRIALNLTDSTVIDVGTAGPLGAQRILDGLPLYGGWPTGREYQDNYGPVIYESYVPLVQAFGYKASSASPNQPVFHAAAILFDLLAIALLFLLGRRVRGPTLGIALAYGWVSYPFSLFSLENNSNDALVVSLLLAALLAATYRSRIALTARGAFAALAGLTKFAPLAAAPVLATHGLRELAPARRPYALALFLVAFLGTAALVFVPAVSHSSLHTFYERTIASAARRETPFSVWGLYGGLGGLQFAVRIAAVVLGLSLAVVPRRPDLVGLAAACAAAIIAVQLADGYWFYFYILWFFPLVMLALLGRFNAPGRPRAAPRSKARSIQSAAASVSGGPALP